MDVALVGFTNSYNDLRWLQQAERWLAENDPATDLAAGRRVIFDLRGPRGSNFLDDAHAFDVVVLFAIYNPPADNLAKAIGRRSGQTSLAANHSRRNWVDRLARTRAQYLFVFRRDDSVDGSWLGEIESFERRPEQPGVFGLSIYVGNRQSRVLPRRPED